MALQNKGQIQSGIKDKYSNIKAENDLFVLESTIFSNVFKKDIKRVFIYKKTERLAKAIHLIAPAFTDAKALGERLETLAVALIDGAIVSPAKGKDDLSKQLLALSSLLALAHASGRLSQMNTDIIRKEVHDLLSEVSEYEEPRFFMDETLTLAELVTKSEKKNALSRGSEGRSLTSPFIAALDKKEPRERTEKKQERSKRQEEILSIIKDKDSVYIKDISTLLRNYSEKTIQRELSTLVISGVLEKNGDKRWTTYRLARS